MLLPTAIVSISVIFPTISKFIGLYYVRHIEKIEQTPNARINLAGST
jgi:hypothetical protein